MKKFDEKFQDCLLIEAIEYINNVRPLLENIVENMEKLEGSEIMFWNNDYKEMHDAFEDFAKRFHSDQYSRFNKKYNPKELDEYMGIKAEVYEAKE